MAADGTPVTKRQYEALANFRYVLRKFLRYSEQVTRAHGITPLQYQLMLHIKGFPGREWASIGELAERMQAKHHGTVALVTRCEKLGLVGRRTNEHDRRSVQVSLTARGEKALQRLAQLHRDQLLALKEQFVVRDLGAPAGNKAHTTKR
jgi:DNA-binding MarR family transcriptional regulator